MAEREDRVYTLTIGDKAILTFPAQSFSEARGLVRENWLLEDLRALKSGGVAVWDGKANPAVRNATDAEQMRFVREVKSLPDNDGDLQIVYLIEIY